MVDSLLAMKAGAGLYLLTPITRGRQGEYKKEPADCGSAGFSASTVNGKIV